MSTSIKNSTKTSNRTATGTKIEEYYLPVNEHMQITGILESEYNGEMGTSIELKQITYDSHTGALLEGNAFDVYAEFLRG